MSWLCILLPHFEYMKKITLDSFQEPTARLVGWTSDSVSNRSQTKLRIASPVALCLRGGIWVATITNRRPDKHPRHVCTWFFLPRHSRVVQLMLSCFLGY